MPYDAPQGMLERIRRLHNLRLQQGTVQKLTEEGKMIRVMIYDPMVESRIPATVPETAPMQKLIPALIDRIKKPKRNERGDMISYMLQKREPGGIRQLRPTETLASAGVAEDEELTLTYKIVPGQ
jgi:cytochrome P450